MPNEIRMHTRFEVVEAKDSLHPVAGGSSILQVSDSIPEML